MPRILKILIVLSVLGALTMTTYGYVYINSVPGSLSEDVIVEIKRGSSVYSAANSLREKRVINSVRLFRIYAGLDGFQSKIKAGEYLMKPAMTAKEIAVAEHACHIEVGMTKMEILTFIENHNIDLVVLGRHSRHGIERLLGSTANAVLNVAPCDVLAVQVSAQ